MIKKLGRGKKPSFLTELRQTTGSFKVSMRFVSRDWGSISPGWRWQLPQCSCQMSHIHLWVLCVCVSLPAFFWLCVPLSLSSHHSLQSCSPWLDHSRSFPWRLQSWGAVCMRNCGSRRGGVSWVWAPGLQWAPFLEAGSLPLEKKKMDTLIYFFSKFSYFALICRNNQPSDKSCDLSIL